MAFGATLPCWHRECAEREACEEAASQLMCEASKSHHAPIASSELREYKLRQLEQLILCITSCSPRTSKAK